MHEPPVQSDRCALSGNYQLESNPERHDKAPLAAAIGKRVYKILLTQSSWSQSQTTAKLKRQNLVSAVLYTLLPWFRSSPTHWTLKTPPQAVFCFLNKTTLCLRVTSIPSLLLARSNAIHIFFSWKRYHYLYNAPPIYIYSRVLSELLSSRYR